MSARATAALPKVRSRSEGAAVPLDELDRRLLNLMQGRFPIAPRPYEHVAAEAGVAEAEGLARVRRPPAQRIIPPGTPILDTPALGSSSMLVAANGGPPLPPRGAPGPHAPPRAAPPPPP